MSIIQKDILVDDTNNLWISEVYICRILGNNFSNYLRSSARPNYRMHINPIHWNDTFLPSCTYSWRYGRLNGMFYYDYDHIPNRSGSKIQSRIGYRETLYFVANSIEKKNKSIKVLLRKLAKSYVSDNIISDFSSFKIKGNSSFTQSNLEQLSEALGWLRMIRNKLNGNSFIEYGISSKTEFYKLCVSILGEIKLYGLKVTTSDSLRKKLHYFPSDSSLQLKFLISRKFGNKNAQKNKKK